MLIRGTQGGRESLGGEFLQRVFGKKCADPAAKIGAEPDLKGNGGKYRGIGKTRGPRQTPQWNGIPGKLAGLVDDSNAALDWQAGT